MAYDDFLACYFGPLLYPMYLKPFVVTLGAIGFAINLVGIVGNVFIFLTLRDPRLRDELHNLSLTCLAAADLVVCCVNFLVDFISFAKKQPFGYFATEEQLQSFVESRLFDRYNYSSVNITGVEKQHGSFGPAFYDMYNDNGTEDEQYERANCLVNIVITTIWVMVHTASVYLTVLVSFGKLSCYNGRIDLYVVVLFSVFFTVPNSIPWDPLTGWESATNFIKGSYSLLLYPTYLYFIPFLLLLCTTTVMMCKRDKDDAEDSKVENNFWKNGSVLAISMMTLFSLLPAVTEMIYLGWPVFTRKIDNFFIDFLLFEVMVGFTQKLNASWKIILYLLCDNKFRKVIFRRITAKYESDNSERFSYMNEAATWNEEIRRSVISARSHSMAHSSSFQSKYFGSTEIY